MIWGILDVKDLPPGTWVSTDSFPSASVMSAVGEEPKTCKTEESLKGEQRVIWALGRLIGGGKFMVAL